VKLLLDECVPARLARFLTDHSVITVDRKISTQQDLTKFKIPVLLLRARTNRLESIRRLVPELLKTVDRATAGTLTTIGG